LWFKKKRNKSFKRVLEVISGPKRSMGIEWFFYGFAAVSPIL